MRRAVAGRRVLRPLIAGGEPPGGLTLERRLTGIVN